MQRRLRRRLEGGARRRGMRLERVGRVWKRGRRKGEEEMGLKSISGERRLGF
jgi:hypothetical protein